MVSKSVSILQESAYSADAVSRAAARIREELGAPATFALAFFTPDYLPHLEEFSDIIRVDGHVSELAGCTGSGIISDNIEHENGSGFSLLAIHSPGTTAEFHDIDASIAETADSTGFWKKNIPASESWLLLTDPFDLPPEDFLAGWSHAFPGTPVVGGLASGGESEETVAVFHNGRILTGGIAMGLRGNLKLIPAISQGCRPIGEPLPVTKAEDNIIFSLGSRPAYQALESAFQSLTESERSSAQGNLFAGLAGTEYIDEFRSGDFLIRNIIGADPNSGAVVIAGIPRLGQTLQYQLRDRASADADLRRSLHRALPSPADRIVASALFCCKGRGQDLFGNTNHDAVVVGDVLGHPHLAGFFCNGEFGPIGGKNCVHSYTAACAIFTEASS